MIADQFRQAFLHRFTGTIWKMDVYEEAGLLAVEWRETSTGSPCFAVIHYPSGRLISNNLSYGNRWWTLAGISREHLILQYYPEPNQARTQGVVLIDFENGKPTYEAFNMQFQELVSEGMIVRQNTTLTTGLSLINEAGQLLKSHVDLSETVPLKRNVKAATPSLYPPLIPLTDQLVEGPYFHLEHEEADFWAFHEKTGTGYRLMLVVCKEQQVVFTEILDPLLSQLQPEVFFIIDRQLFFIRNNKQEFVSYFV